MRPGVPAGDDSIEGLAEDGVGRGGDNRREMGGQGARVLSCADVFGMDDDAADFALAAAPGTRLPFEPLEPSVGAREPHSVQTLDRAGKASPVHFALRQGHFECNIVVAGADRRSFDAKTRIPGWAGRHAAHVAIKHGRGDGGIFDKKAQSQLAFALKLFAATQTFTEILFLGDVARGAGVVQTRRK